MPTKYINTYCKRCNKELNQVCWQTKHCDECRVIIRHERERRYRLSEKGKKTKQAYYRREKTQAALRAYRNSVHGKAIHRAYIQTP